MRRFIPEKYVIRRTLIQGVTREIQRAGEGSSVILKDHSILLAYSEFSGKSDEAYARIVKRISKDSGLTWSEPELLIEKKRKESLNVMSPGLLRLHDGRIAFSYLEKHDERNFVPYVIFSSDEGVSWTVPAPLEKLESGYYSINNDRLCQISSGRIILPFNQYYFNGDDKRDNGRCGIFYSDDNGVSWKKSDCISVRKENIISPVNLAPEKESSWHGIVENGMQNQEPGIIELLDGTLMMWVRTKGAYMYKSVSCDKGCSWSPFVPVPSIVAPLSPQSIKRIPDSNRLICVYNDHSNYMFGYEPRWSWRTPLTIAVSDNDGESWDYLFEIEDDSHNYCYTSILFVDGNLLLTYYKSENMMKADGTEERRNLASLQSILISIDALV